MDTNIIYTGVYSQLEIIFHMYLLLYTLYINYDVICGYHRGISWNTKFENLCKDVLETKFKKPPKQSLNNMEICFQKLSLFSKKIPPKFPAIGHDKQL